MFGNRATEPCCSIPLYRRLKMCDSWGHAGRRHREAALGFHEEKRVGRITLFFFLKDSINLASCSIQPENLDPFSSSLLIKTYSRGWVLCYCVGANWSKHAGTIKSSFRNTSSAIQAICALVFAAPCSVMNAEPMICHLGHFPMK